MSDLVAVAIVNGIFSILASTLTYLGVRHRVDKQGAEVGEKLDQAAAKVDETRDVNLVQIATSNNFNQKLEKIHQGQQFLIRRVESLDRDIKVISAKTGIPLND